MSTLKELVAKHGLPVKVCKGEDTFDIRYQEDSCYYGHNQYGSPTRFPEAVNGEWELYQEPKKKVKRWLWSYMNTGSIQKTFTSAFYSDEEIMEFNDGRAVKLLWSETEFEE